MYYGKCSIANLILKIEYRENKYNYFLNNEENEEMLIIRDEYIYITAKKNI